MSLTKKQETKEVEQMDALGGFYVGAVFLVIAFCLILVIAQGFFK